MFEWRQQNPSPAALAAGSFTIGEARLHGVSPWRAKAADIHVPSRGIRVPAGREQPLLARARPYTRLGTADTVSFYSAADIHRFKLPGDRVNAGSAPSATLLHLTRNGSAAPRRKGVVGHRSALAAAEIVILQGVPVTSIPRTLLDLAGTGSLSRDDIVVIIDALRRERTADAGWRQLVLNKVDVRNGEGWVLTRVRLALRAQGWTG